jgi:hypothetical protein
MNDPEMAFPGFTPAKPKGVVPAEVATAVFPKPKRKRRTAAELEAAGVLKKKKMKPRGGTIPLGSLIAFAGLSSDEIDQVINLCADINTFPKAARKRIAAAIAQLFS